MITERLPAANRCLRSFAPTTELAIDRGYVIVRFPLTIRGQRQTVSRRWMTRGQDFYPTWKNIWPHGGTATTALAQLVRWIKELPVLPITSWEYWASDQVKLLSRDAADQLKRDGYPVTAKCVLCDQEVKSLDWWSLDGVSGPCCGWTTGCRQRPSQ